MDVCGLFLGDSTSLSAGGMRNIYYRDYEQFPYGTLENVNVVCKDSYSKVQEKCHGAKAHKLAKTPCPFCKENKKRPLVSYLRKRNFRKHTESIGEEDEHSCSEAEDEEEEEEKNAQQQQQQQQQQNESCCKFPPKA